MAARNISFVRGGYYHLYNRGANRAPIFYEAENYRFALRKLKQYAKALQITVIAYCLLPNHYHLLVRQDGEERAGLLPQRLFNSYTKAFNRRYDRTGTLFADPFRALAVDQDDYVRHLCRYIHANPVRHGLVATPAAWTCSNYLEWIGARNGTLVDRAFIAAHFPGRDQYRRFVDSYLRGEVLLPTRLDAQLRTMET